MSAEAIHSSELENTPLRKLFWKYTLPTIAAMFANGIYTFVDGLFVGRYVGADGLAAMNLLWTVYGFAIGLGIMVGTAAAALFSIEKGKGNPELARRYLANGMFLILVFSLLSSLVFRFATHGILVFQLPDSPVVLDYAAEYLGVFIPFSCCPLFASALPMYIRNDERPQLATRLMVIAACINVVGDYLLIVHFSMGMFGAAVATALAQGFVLVYGLVYFFSNRANLRLHISDFKISFSLCGKIIMLGISSLIMAIYYCLIAIAYNFFFAKYGGSIAIAAYAIIGYVGYFYFLIAEGMTGGIQPIISYNFGAKKYYNVRRILAVTVKVLFFSYLVFLALIQLFAPQITAAFSADDLALTAETIRGLRLFLLTCFLEGFILLGIVYFQAVDESRKSAVLSVMNLFVQLPFMFVLSHYWGLTGLWLVYPMANIPLAGIVLLYMLGSFRKLSIRLHKARKLRASALQTALQAL